MAINSVADSPFIANVSAELARAGNYARKVPMRYYRTGLIALALFWACHTLANLFWIIIPAPSAPVAKVTPTTTSLQTTSRANVDIASVQKLNVFGSFNEAQAAADTQPQEPAENLPITDLNVELQGVIEGSEPEYSWAIIGKGDNQKLYKIGDEIEAARGAKVAKIFKTKIVINNKGKFEELWLYGEDGKNFAVSSAPTQRPQTSRAPQQRAVIKADQIKKAKNIGDVVRFMVATENGKMIGYKVRPGRQRELFDQVGLKTDDIVVSVNGIEVNEPQKVREVYQALKTATEASLQVLRDGTTQSIQITMDTEG